MAVPLTPRDRFGTLDLVTLLDRRRVAALLVAALAFVSLGSFVHTDDGCQVEIHCLACRLALGNAVGAAILASDAAAPAAAPDRPVSARECAPVAPASRPRSSRAPPLT
jgi:hypothetical protein